MRRFARRWGTALLIASFLASACGGSEPGGGFTLPRAYDQLDLGTPAAAAAEFGSAFVRRDFITAALLFHPETQLMIIRQGRNGDYGSWVMDHGVGPVSSRVDTERAGAHALDGMRTFEVAMQEAIRAGALPIDLTKGFSDIATAHEDPYNALVAVTLAANDANAIVELAPGPSGRWRIRQVRLDNGSPAEIPFSGRPPEPPIPEVVETFTTMRDQLPATRPSDTVETFARLVGAGDFVSAYLLLDSRSQQLVASALPAVNAGEHWFTAALFDEFYDTRPFTFDLSNVRNITALTESPTLTSPWSVSFETDTATLHATLLRDEEGRWRLSELRQPGSGMPGDLPFPLEGRSGA